MAQVNGGGGLHRAGGGEGEGREMWVETKPVMGSGIGSHIFKWNCSV